MLRGYGADGRIVDGRVVSEGEDAEPALDELFADDRVAFVHARALVFGCDTFAIDRRPDRAVIVGRCPRRSTPPQTA